MSFLDLYQSGQAESLRIKPNEAPDLPAKFGDTFDAAWSENLLFGQSIANENARAAALQDHIDEVKSRTGKDISAKVDWDAVAPGAEMTSYTTASMQLDDINAEAEKNGLPALSGEELDERAMAKSRIARADYATMSAREKTLGGSVGMFLGGAAGASTDPINLVALPIAPETAGVGVLAAALRWAVVGAGAQAAIEVAGMPFRDKVQPGYGDSSQPMVNIVEAGLGGAVLGGGTKALGNLWTRVKSGQWPTTVRDAGNVIESEANTANTNVYPGVDGEVAHRQALSKTIDDFAAGRPADVDSIITPEIAAARETRMSEILGAREEAIFAQKEAQVERAAMQVEDSPDLPFGQTAKEAEMEGHLGDIAFGVQNIARDAGYAMGRDEADRIAARVANATDDDARRILEEAAIRPRTLEDTLPPKGRMPTEPKADSAPVAAAKAELAKDLTPETVAKLAKDPELDETVLRDLDRLRAEGKDIDVPMGEAIGADGERMAVRRKVDDVLADIDERMAAAREIEACAGPQREAAE